MDAIGTQESDGERGRARAWQVARWLITAAAALLLVTLFLSQTTGTEAAAPVASTDTAVYHEMATTCPAGYNCAAYNCVGGNFCGYNYNYNFGYIGANYALTYGNYITPAYVGSNFCPSGNFTACYAGTGYYGYTGNGYCASGNYSCYNAYPYLGANYFGGYPYGYAGYYAGYPYGYTGTYSGQTTIVVPAKNITVVGPPVYVKEVAQPAATTVTAAPIAPVAGMATAMNAPAAAPVGGSNDVKIYSAPPAAPQGVQIDPSEQR